MTRGSAAIPCCRFSPDGGRTAPGTGRAGALVMIFCILDEENVDAVLKPLFDLVSRQIGIVTVSDVQVVRPEYF